MTKTETMTITAALIIAIALVVGLGIMTRQAGEAPETAADTEATTEADADADDAESEDASQEKIQTISSGEEVRIDEYLQANRRTVVVFMAGWSSASQELETWLEERVESSGRTQLLIIDIGPSVSSPVATQYGIKRLPAAWLYEGEKRTATRVAAVRKALGGK